MSTRIVFRIEHSDGYGYFRSKVNGVKRPHSIDCKERFKELENRHITFNNPFRDGPFLEMKFDRDIHVCAYKSLEDLKKFVYPSEIKDLVELGYKVLKITCANPLIGFHQIAYDPKDIIFSEDITNQF